MKKLKSTRGLFVCKKLTFSLMSTVALVLPAVSFAESKSETKAAVPKDLSTLQIATAEIAPFTIDKDKKGQLEGVVGEIVLAAFKQDPVLKNIKYTFLPWKNAQDTVQKGNNYLIFPITRTEAREPLYKWASSALETGAYIFTVKPNPVAKDLDSVKKLKKIGALAGSPPETEVKKLVPPELLDPMTNEEQNAKRLFNKQGIDGWSTQDFVAYFTFRKLGYDVGALQKGHKFFPQSLYVAASKGVSDEAVKYVGDVIEKFKKTPEYKAIVTKYSVKD